MSLINIKSHYAYLQHLADSGMYRNNSSRDEHSKTQNSNQLFFLHAISNSLSPFINNFIKHNNKLRLVLNMNNRT